MSETNGATGRDPELLALIAERDRLKQRVMDLESRIIHDRELVEKAATIDFERSFLQTAVSILSKKRFHTVDRSLLDFINENADNMSIMDVVDEWKKEKS